MWRANTPTLAQDRPKFKLSHPHTMARCQEAALTRRTSWRRSGGGVRLSPSGKQLYPATPELTTWWEKPADRSQ